MFNINRSKEGQEEMIGFVLIIVLVAIVAVVFLGIQIRKSPEMETSREISSFLSSSLMYTTKCKTEPENIRNIENLIRDCGREESCLDGRPTCEVLNKTMANILKRNFPLNKYGGYRFRVYRENKTSIINLKRGNESVDMEGEKVDIGGSGLKVSLRLYPR